MSDYRDVVWGMDGETGWTDLLPGSGLAGLRTKGKWTRDGDRLVVDSPKGAASLDAGDPDWRNYELDVHLTPETGGNVQIGFRRSEDALRGYVLDFLLGWQAIAISWADRDAFDGLEKLSVVDHEIVRGREYHVRLCVRDASFTSYVDGRLVNQLTDRGQRTGGFSLTAWQARTVYRRPRYRRL